MNEINSFTKIMESAKNELADSVTEIQNQIIEEKQAPKPEEELSGPEAELANYINQIVRHENATEKHKEWLNFALDARNGKFEMTKDESGRTVCLMPETNAKFHMPTDSEVFRLQEMVNMYQQETERLRDECAKETGIYYLNGNTYFAEDAKSYLNVEMDTNPLIITANQTKNIVVNLAPCGAEVQVAGKPEIMKEGCVLATAIDGNGEPLIDTTGNMVQWQISVDELKNKYGATLPVQDWQQLSQEMTQQKLVQISTDIAIKTPTGPNGSMEYQAVAAGEFLNVTDENNIRPVTAQELDNFQVIETNKELDEHINDESQKDESCMLV